MQAYYEVISVLNEDARQLKHNQKPKKIPESIINLRLLL